jgi:hypothetical protein
LSPPLSEVRIESIGRDRRRVRLGIVCAARAVIADQDLVAARLAAHDVGVVGKAHRRLVGLSLPVTIRLLASSMLTWILIAVHGEYEGLIRSRTEYRSRRAL